VRRPLLALAALATAACGGRVQTGITPVPAMRAIARYADSVVAAPAWRNAHWGLLIVDPTSGDTLYRHNGQKLFMPASNQKIVTGSTALTQLGADYRYRTRFASAGAVTDGVLKSDLVVFGRGDPSWSDAMRGDYRRAFLEMADSLAAHGVKRIAGTLRKGGDAFSDDQYGFGWEFDDADEPYGAGVDELYTNEGFTKVRRTNARGDSVTAEVAIHDHVAFFFASLREGLAARGIAVAGSTDIVAPATDADAPNTLFTLVSPPLREILKAVEKPSQNQIAEILFKTLALEKTGVGTADSGRRVVERQLAAWGAAADGYAVRDGSGLSRHDYVSPETLVRILDTMRRRQDFDVWYDALPIGGVDGTIANRMKGTPAERNVHAKTGTVDRARSLSGYVTTADGRMLIFSFLCNNFTMRNADVEKVQDTILAQLAATRLGGR
jgi:D-alanyl-D-alanine carboxypeptidase/D-alanyl-D-alanine-endopeptidase (penicillin-binding protein 4)